MCLMPNDHASQILIGGIEKRRIVIHDYDSTWPDKFAVHAHGSPSVRCTRSQRPTSSGQRGRIDRLRKFMLGQHTGKFPRHEAAAVVTADVGPRHELSRDLARQGHHPRRVAVDDGADGGHRGKGTGHISR